MKMLFVLFFAMGLLTSCNDDNPLARKDGNTTKDKKEEKTDRDKKDEDGYDTKDKNAATGNWSAKQTDEWRNRCLSEYRGEPNVNQMCDCMIDKIAKKYPDESDAKDADEHDLEKLVKDCETRFKNDNNDDGGYVKTVERNDVSGDQQNTESWTNLQRQSFIKGCAAAAQQQQGFNAQQANSYCDCMTRRVEKKYSFDKAAKLTAADFQTQEWINAAAECRSGN